MSEPMSDERLEQIKARAAAATTGPWECYGDGAHEVFDAGEYSDGYLGEVVAPVVTKLNDAEFIAQAREDIPALLNEIDRLHEEVRDQRHVADMLARVVKAAHRREDRVRDRLSKILPDKTRVVTDEMVERAAKAMYDQECGSGWAADPWEDERDEFLELAREVIEAALGGAS